MMRFTRKANNRLELVTSKELYGMFNVWIHQFVVQDKGYHFSELFMNTADSRR